MAETKPGKQLKRPPLTPNIPIRTVCHFPTLGDVVYRGNPSLKSRKRKLERCACIGGWTPLFARRTGRKCYLFGEYQRATVSSQRILVASVSVFMESEGTAWKLAGCWISTSQRAISSREPLIFSFTAISW